MHNQNLILQHIITRNFFEYYHFRYGHSLIMELHKQNFHGIFLLCEGTGSCLYNGETFRLQAGDILLINSDSGKRPAVSLSAPFYEYVTLWLDDHFFSSMKMTGEDLMHCFKESLQQDRILLHPDPQIVDAVRKACGRIEQEQSETAYGNHILMYSAVIEILVLITRAYSELPHTRQKDRTDNELINQILIYINEHVTEDLTLDQIARQFYISRNYFSHQFKLYTGCSPYQYILKKRLNIAHSMLSNGANVSDACDSCGFNDYSNLLKAFRREFGKNPSEIKNYS